MIDTVALLIEISKKLNRIEEKDCDFIKNANWLKLRKQQEKLWIDVAKERLIYLQSKNKISLTKKDINLIKFYKDFIQKGEDNDRKNIE